MGIPTQVATASRALRRLPGILPVPRLRERARGFGPVRVEPPVEGSVLLHPQVGRRPEALDAATQVHGPTHPVLAATGGGRPPAALLLDRELFGVGAVGVGDAEGGAGVLLVGEAHRVEGSGGAGA